jgi:hypothetical protein
MAEEWRVTVFFLWYFLGVNKRYIELEKLINSYDNEAFTPQFFEEETEYVCDIQSKSKQ